MPFVTLSATQIKQNTLIPVGWYFVKINKIGEKTAASGNSTNYPIEGEILRNAETGSTEYAGFPTPRNWQLNSEFTSGVINFLAALKAEVKADERINLSAAEGQIIRVFIEQGEYNKMPQNQINHKYAPAE
jgi:hypothetical protein